MSNIDQFHPYFVQARLSGSNPVNLTTGNVAGRDTDELGRFSDRATVLVVRSIPLPIALNRLSGSACPKQGQVIGARRRL